MYTVSASYVKLVVNMLQEEGLDTVRLCHEAGLDTQRLNQEDFFFTRSSVYRLLELAAHDSGNPGIGLKAYTHFLPGSFHLVGYTMMSSANLHQALERLTRFAPLLGSGISLFFTPENGYWRLSVLEHPEEGSPLPRQIQDVGVASLLGFCRWLTGGNLPKPVAVELAYPEPQDISEYLWLLDCPLRFGAPRNSVLFNAEDLLMPLSTANRALATLHENFAETRLNLLYGHSLAAQTRTLIAEHLGQGMADMESVAAALCISKRTLQRGLEKEGVQFKDILSDVRKRLAIHYLRYSQHKLAQIADLLGFHDQSSFHKACMRWFGMPPGRYRQLRDGNSKSPLCDAAHEIAPAGHEQTIQRRAHGRDA